MRVWMGVSLCEMRWRLVQVVSCPKTAGIQHDASAKSHIASAFVAISSFFLLVLHCLTLVSLCGNVCVSRHASHVYMPREGDWEPFLRIWKRPQVDFIVWGPKTNTWLRAFTSAVCCPFQTLLVSCFIFLFSTFAGGPCSPTTFSFGWRTVLTYKCSSCFVETPNLLLSAAPSSTLAGSFLV